MQVVIVEDQAMFREFIHQVVEQDLNLRVIGEASDGVEAVEVCRRLRPQLVILDILIPKLSGLHVAQTVIEEIQGCKVLALSAEFDQTTLHQLHQLGVHGFVDKTAKTTATLKEAISLVAAGKTYYSDVLRETISAMRQTPFSFEKILTRRESQVLSFVGGGLTDSEIGKIIGLSASSVQSHRRNLMKKLDVHSTPELIQFAQDKGFWKPAFNQMELTHSYHIFK